MFIQSSLDSLEKYKLSANRLLLIYQCALFLSAFLIFTIQPLFTRLVLPSLGGAPIVWSINLCFFQGCLLCGYLYAHKIMRFFSLKQAILLHMALLVGIATAFLPIQMPLPPQEASKSILWLITTLVTTIGLPFFILSATAPLLQSWFQSTDHPQADDPYFLYVASNWGSIAGLFLFIILFEPLMTLTQQRVLWSYGFGFLVFLISILGLQSLLQNRLSKSSSESFSSISWHDRFLWMALAFVPSGLLVALTALLSIDVSSFPLLWIFPLALYLLTFILTFSQNPFVNLELFNRIHPIFAIFALIISLSLGVFRLLYFSFFFYVGIFFITAMVCHGQLVKHRPMGAQCTDFYLWLSFGSILGALFATFIAPFLFSSMIEFSLLILVGVFLRSLKIQRNQFLLWFSLPALIYFIVSLFVLPEKRIQFFVTYFLVILIVSLFQVSIKRQSCLTGLLCAVFLLGNSMRGENIVQRYRSIFGIYTITESVLDNSTRKRVLLHGNTVHGAELISADQSSSHKPEPLTYYYPNGSLHATIESVRSRKGNLRVGVVGLGAGSLACYKKAEDQWTLFEIDPLIVALAQKHFHFLSACAPNTPIILGDGRLNLGRSGQIYDLIILDAFSSDGIPAHLITREALQTYKSALAEDGLIVFHISNRYINLAPIIASTAQLEGFRTWQNPKVEVDDQKRDNLWFPPKVVVAATQEESLGPLSLTWIPIESRIPPWTDDYANVLGALWRGIER